MHWIWLDLFDVGQCKSLEGRISFRAYEVFFDYWLGTAANFKGRSVFAPPSEIGLVGVPSFFFSSFPSSTHSLQQKILMMVMSSRRDGCWGLRCLKYGEKDCLHENNERVIVQVSFIAKLIDTWHDGMYYLEDNMGISQLGKEKKVRKASGSAFVEMVEV